MNEDKGSATVGVCMKNSVRRVLADIAEDYKKENKLSASNLQTLHCFYGATFERALELYESKKITECKIDPKQLTNKERAVCCFFYEVKGQSSEVYTIFPSINFCSCLAFENQVLKERSTVTCKHILAVWLASLTQAHLNCQTIPKSEFSEVLLQRVSY